jgi:hypothetical protein
MIAYLKRNQIDVEKYDACIENSLQSRIYAFSWYLDIVADNWDVLVLNDYEAVMPLPWKQKYFIKYITQPYFCQQLGIFSKRKVSTIDVQNFVSKIPRKFLKVVLNFNSANLFESRKVKKHNYILPLSESYSNLFKIFNKGRKHAVKSGHKNELRIDISSVDQLLKIKKENYSYAKTGKVDFSLLINIANYILENNKGFVLGVFKNDVILGGGIILNDNKRITYLFSSFNDDGKKLQAPTFLVNQLVKTHSESGLFLDFEGSMIPSIASFYRSFGAVKEEYFHYRK